MKIINDKMNELMYASEARERVSENQHSEAYEMLVGELYKAIKSNKSSFSFSPKADFYSWEIDEVILKGYKISENFGVYYVSFRLSSI